MQADAQSRVSGQSRGKKQNKTKQTNKKQLKKKKKRKKRWRGYNPPTTLLLRFRTKTEASPHLAARFQNKKP